MALVFFLSIYDLKSVALESPEPQKVVKIQPINTPPTPPPEPEFVESTLPEPDYPEPDFPEPDIPEPDFPDDVAPINTPTPEPAFTPEATPVPEPTVIPTPIPSPTPTPTPPTEPMPTRMPRDFRATPSNPVDSFKELMRYQQEMEKFRQENSIPSAEPVDSDERLAFQKAISNLIIDPNNGISYEKLKEMAKANDMDVNQMLEQLSDKMPAIKEKAKTYVEDLGMTLEEAAKSAGPDGMDENEFVLLSALQNYFDWNIPSLGPGSAGRPTQPRTAPTPVPDPTPTPFMIPDWKEGSIGIPYIVFKYAGREFRVTWEEPPQEIKINHYPRSRVREQETFKMPWKRDWENQKGVMVKDVLMEYLKKK